jgi:UTP:GlnB (protein PII) uridylyltransferase
MQFPICWLILPAGNDYDDILTVAAWFHDVCNGEVDHTQHAALGASRTMELLIAHCAGHYIR